MKRAQEGYILLFALLVSTLAVIIVTYITYRGTIYVPYMNIVQKREKAKWLAFGGLQLALSQLAHIHESPTEQAQTAQEGAQDEQKTLLINLVPLLGRWQTILLREKKEGIDAEIKLCITSEEGKININNLYDFQKHQFKKGPGQADAKKLLEEILATIQKSTKNADLFKSFENFLRSRQYKLQDVTELFLVPGFELFQERLWYEPREVKQGTENMLPDLYLNDLFTIWTDSTMINPWLFTDSLKGVLQMKQVAQITQEQMKQIVQERLQKIQQQTQWAKEWDPIIGSWSNRLYKQLLEPIKAYLANRFEPRMFSVMVHATVAGVTQRMCAVVERSALPSDASSNVQISNKQENNKSTNGQKQKQSSQFVCNIKKLYWL